MKVWVIKYALANKTVETLIFLSLMSYSLNIYLNYINKTVDEKDPLWMSGWSRNCHQMKKTMFEYVRSGDFLFDSPTSLKMYVVANLLSFIHTRIMVLLL